MSKRSLATENDDYIEHRKCQQRKRPKVTNVDHISPLPEEIILKILSFLPARLLTICQQLSQRLATMTEDPQLWKALYYDDFVRPRAVRIPGIRRQQAPSATLSFSSKISKWLEHDHLAKEPSTDWKSHYKLRHNWSRGAVFPSGVTEMQIAKQLSSVSPVLVQVHNDLVVTVSPSEGLKAWSLATCQLLTSSPPETLSNTRTRNSNPTCLTVGRTYAGTRLSIAVGFEDGCFCLYGLELSSHSKSRSIAEVRKSPQPVDILFERDSASGEPITAMSYTSPYLGVMNGAQLLSLYVISPETASGTTHVHARLLSSLRSHTAWPPLSLSLRVQTSGIVASVAYALPTYLAGWTVGLQELQMTFDGTVTRSRLASAAQQRFSGISKPQSEPPAYMADQSSGAYIASQPTSLSYSHPYLLASHADNTLTLYLAHSSAEDLSISTAYRLWGHTSAISDVQVGDRGKAVSVSSCEIRVWELEGIPRRRGHNESGVEVRPRHSLSDSIEAYSATDFIRSAGFDDERVFLLRDGSHGQNFVVYNFGR